MNRHFIGRSLVIAVFFLGITKAVVAANGFYTMPPAPPQAPYFTGSYVGIGVGMVSPHANVNAEGNVYLYPLVILHNGYPHHLNKSQNFDMSKFGFNGDIFAGYGKTFESSSSYYIGGEIFGNYFRSTLNGSSYSLNTESSPVYATNIDIKVENPRSFGGDIRAGYLVSPRTMVYILFGLDYARFDVKSEFTYQTFVQPITSGYFAHDFSKWKLGYMPGVGIEIGLIDNISLRAQYTYTYYSLLSYSTSLTDEPPEPGPDPYKASLTTKVKPSRGLFTVKLSYLFN
ncbi:MAG: hypothetical protein AMJ43_01715 [Coxiella sp. DG_40]|nr:MAG: hypothetical protein AMJ43_01715 [Coxiella sp. DG_40]